MPNRRYSEVHPDTEVGRTTQRKTDADWKVGGTAPERTRATFIETCNPNAYVKKLPQQKGKE